MPPAADFLESLLKNKKQKGTENFARSNKMILIGKTCFFDSCSCGQSEIIIEVA